MSNQNILEWRRKHLLLKSEREVRLGLFETRLWCLIYIYWFGNDIDLWKHWVSHRPMWTSCQSLVFSFIPPCAAAMCCIQSSDNFSNSRLFPNTTLECLCPYVISSQGSASHFSKQEGICIGCPCSSGWIIHDLAYCQLGSRSAKTVLWEECQRRVGWNSFRCLFHRTVMLNKVEDTLSRMYDLPFKICPSPLTTQKIT